MERKCLVGILVVFVICLATRIFYVHEKSILEGDELTSLTLAYNNTGWGDNTYAPDVAYTADRLRCNLYTDDTGGFTGYANDIKALWLDNRDPSHASLYYMLLRTSLLMVGHASIDEVVRWGCALNIALFALTFLFAFLSAKMLLRRHPHLIAAALLVAFMNPMSVSNALLLREYQLAECLAAIFFFIFLKIVGQVKDGKSPLTVANVVMASLAAAAFVSAGYFNTFLVILACCYLIYAAKRCGMAGKACTMVAICLPLSLLFATMLYSGFFNFLTDIRTAEVVGKAQGGGFVSNTVLAVKSGGKFLCLDILNPLLIAAIATLAVKSRKTLTAHLRQSRWPYFAIAACWFASILFFATWKEPRYVAPCCSLLCLALIATLQELLAKSNKYVITAAMLITAAYTLASGRILYVHPSLLEGFQWPEAKNMYLYGPNSDERSTLTLLVPYMRDNQTCTILQSTEEINAVCECSDSTTYVFGASFPELKVLPCFKSSYAFNPWQDIYEYQPSAI